METEGERGLQFVKFQKFVATVYTCIAENFLMVQIFVRIFHKNFENKNSSKNFISICIT